MSMVLRSAAYSRKGAPLLKQITLWKASFEKTTVLHSRISQRELRINQVKTDSVYFLPQVLDVKSSRFRY